MMNNPHRVPQESIIFQGGENSGFAKVGCEMKEVQYSTQTQLGDGFSKPVPICYKVMCRSLK